MTNNQLRKKTTSVEPPDNLAMGELDYKSKSSLGYQRLPQNAGAAMTNNMRFKKNSSELEDIVLPSYGIGMNAPGDHGY